MAADTTLKRAVVNIKIFGVGGGGNSVLLRMAEDSAFNVELIGINTDTKMLSRLAREGINTLAIGERLTGGRGTGSDIELGMNAARTDAGRLKQSIVGADLVFVTAGMGAGTGTGAAPIVAKIAKDLGILTVGVVTLPFSWEGNRKRQIADIGVAKMKDNMDALITVKNDNLLKLPEYKSMSLVDAFKAADNVLRQAIECISEVILTTGVVNIDFADVRTVFRKSGHSDVFWGIGEDDQGRAVEAVKNAISSPLIERPIKGAKGVILNITGGESLTLYEVNEASQYINSHTHPAVDLNFGVVSRPELGTKVRATLIATDFDDSLAPIGRPRQAVKTITIAGAGTKKSSAPVSPPPKMETKPAEPVKKTGLDSLSVPSFMGGGKSEEKAAANASKPPIGLGHMSSIPHWTNDFNKKN